MSKETKYYINPRDEVSVKKALLIGKLGLVILPLIGMISPILLAIFLSDKKIIPDWGIGIGILVGFILAWFIWSLLIIRWKIWAYSRVRNINDLRKKAIEEKLIWPDGSWFEKTEIGTPKQRKQLIGLSVRFLDIDVFDEDLNIPEELVITYGKDRVAELIIALFFSGIGVYYLFFTEKYLIALFPFLIASVAVFGLNKKTNIKEFRLNKEGIKVDKIFFSSWSEIENDRVYKTGTGSSVEYFFIFLSNYGETKISLNKYKVKPKKLESALRTYRIRFNKSKTT